ncbi:flavodoxin domain-containing protein [Microbacterium sp. BWT-B31]|uniref:flavodoxin family protein n=1 Tax=Microbacterium sp. BWT-B31 TaxID=3232072 RepID=UPI0035281F2E
MKSLVVYESMFGNTHDIAEAIAIGLADTGDVDILDVSNAPTDLAGVDLLVVGGPTHAFSMSRENSRSEAVSKGATDASTTGIREWLDALPAQGPHPPLATFDTHAKQRWIPGSAAKAAAKEAKHHGLRAVASESFYVEGTEGPLAEGELERATAWGRSLTEA